MKRRKSTWLAVAVIFCAVAAASYSRSLTAIIPQSQQQPGYSVGTTESEAVGDWPTYHRDLSRSGFDPTLGSVGSVALKWKSIPLDGDVYAEPLIVRGEIIVATENNSIYDIDADSGSMIWRSNLGAPVDGGELPCGDINPSGITSTPVVDLSSDTIYAVAFLHSFHHELFAVDLNTGEVKSHVSVDPSGADPRVEQQRAALTVANGFVYVAYGGLDGDCGEYHGWVVASPTNAFGGNSESSGIINYRVPSEWGAGIWAPSGPAVDADGNLYVATGNSNGTTASSFDFGNSVIKLSPKLKMLDWFSPTNWAELDRDDLDLGSTGPLILNSNFTLQIGKDGIGYLLNAKHLGGVGGQAFALQVCGPEGLAGAYGGLAYEPPFVFIPCTDGVVALRMNLEAASYSIAWRGPAFDPGPPIVAGGAVWIADVVDGVIYAINEFSGRIIFQDAVGQVARFTTPSSADGEILVAAGRRLIAYEVESFQQETSYDGALISHQISLNVTVSDAPPTILLAFLGLSARGRYEP